MFPSSNTCIFLLSSRRQSDDEHHCIISEQRSLFSLIKTTPSDIDYFTLQHSIVAVISKLLFGTYLLFWTDSSEHFYVRQEGVEKLEVTGQFG